MSTEIVANVVTLSLEDKLAVRNAQLKLAKAKEGIHSAIAVAQQMDADAISLFKEIAKKLNLNIEEYTFDTDNLTFILVNPVVNIPPIQRK